VIARQFFDTPFYGVRQMTWHQRAKGRLVNVKRVRRLASLRHAPSMTVLLAA
jgi:putative transposase